MQIVLTTSRGSKFGTFNNWNDANLAAKSIWRKNYYSDIHYFIEFDSKQEAYGSIDIEPHDFFAPNCSNIITTHLKTFWGNVSKLEPQKAKIYGFSNDDITYFKYLLTELPNN